MALKKELRLAVEAKLHIGLTPKEVAHATGVKLPTVYAISQALKKKEDDELVAELHTIPSPVIAEVITKAKEMEVSTATMEAVAVGAEGLKKLDSAFQTTTINVLRRFDLLLLDEDLPLKDIVFIVNATASAYEKIFSSGTNIHIGDNNQHSNQQLTVFKNKQGV